MRSSSEVALLARCADSSDTDRSKVDPRCRTEVAVDDKFDVTPKQRF